MQQEWLWAAPVMVVVGCRCRPETGRVGRAGEGGPSVQRQRGRNRQVWWWQATGRNKSAWEAWEAGAWRVRRRSERRDQGVCVWGGGWVQSAPARCRVCLYVLRHVHSSDGRQGSNSTHPGVLFRGVGVWWWGGAGGALFGNSPAG